MLSRNTSNESNELPKKKIPSPIPDKIETAQKIAPSPKTDKIESVEKKSDVPELVKKVPKKEISIEPVKPKPFQKELVTPAFNQGVCNVPPKECKSAQIPVSKPIEKVEENVPSKVPVAEVKLDKKPSIMFGGSRIKQQPAKPMETRIFYKDIKIRPLKPGITKVKIQQGDEKAKTFFITEAIPEIDAYLAYIGKNIDEFVKTDEATSYIPVLDEMVLAKFEGLYYRALVEEISNEADPIYNVFFVDYGNALQVIKEEMKPFSPKLKSEIVLNAVFFENYPDELDDKALGIITKEEGFDINITGELDGVYIAKILGI